MITKKRSFKDSLIKWKYAMETGCNTFNLTDWLEIHHPEIYAYLGRCGLCERYDSDCAKCPLGKSGHECNNSEYWRKDAIPEKDDYYRNWRASKTKKTRIKYATLMYNLLLKLSKPVKRNKA